MSVTDPAFPLLECWVTVRLLGAIIASAAAGEVVALCLAVYWLGQNHGERRSELYRAMQHREEEG